MNEKSFSTQSDMFIAYPINRAFVEGRAKHPALIEYWAGGIVGLLVSLTLIVVGLGIIPIPFGESEGMIRLVLLLTGLLSLVGDVVLLSMALRLRNGRLVEGQVTEAELRPYRTHQQLQRIVIRYLDPQGQPQVMVHRRKHTDSRPLPEVGTRAAVLYVSPNVQRLL